MPRRLAGWEISALAIPTMSSLLCLKTASDVLVPRHGTVKATVSQINVCNLVLLPGLQVDLNKK